jgi:hypothetical protein
MGRIATPQGFYLLLYPAGKRWNVMVSFAT